MQHSFHSEMTESKRKEKWHIILHQEIYKYVSLPTLKSEDSSFPYNWLKNSGSSSMNLRNLELKFLSGPPSSAESERLYISRGKMRLKGISNPPKIKNY